MESGFLLINKPVDWTSHDVVAYIRNIVRSYYKKIGLPDDLPDEALAKAGAKKIRVGHAGTLDPFATGLLIVGIGREATKRLDEFKALPKTYVATIKLGATSSTYDKTGKITPTNIVHQKNKGNVTMKQCNNETIEEILNSFIGKQTQIPPMYSAKKVGGKKLYELARKGIEIERQPHEIEIHKIKMIDFDPDSLVLCVSCLVSSGTYIRSLAHDIGQALGTGAYCEELERTQIGDYQVKNATEPKKITKDNFERELFLP